MSIGDRILAKSLIEVIDRMIYKYESTVRDFIETEEIVEDFRVLKAWYNIRIKLEENMEVE